MTTKMKTPDDQEELKKKVQIICLYFSKLISEDKRRRKIISKYRELEMLTGIKANTIRQWTDSLDPYFDNGRRGYYQRDLEKSNKNLWEVYKQYKDFSLSELQNKVSDIYVELDNDEYFLCKDGKEVYLYSIKTKKEETSTSLYNLDASTEIIDHIIRIDNLNRYNPKTSNSQKLKVGDLLFLSLGGDKEKWKEWENGLTAIGQVESIYANNSTKNYEISAKILIKFPTEITPRDLYYYPDTTNEFNIGPSLKGTPNQAINRVTEKGALSIFSAICDLFPDYEQSIKHLIGEENFQRLDDVPKLLTGGEYEANNIIDTLELDYEGSSDLIDKVNKLDINSGIDEEMSDMHVKLMSDQIEFEEAKDSLMKSSLIEQEKKISVFSRTLSITDIKKLHNRFREYKNDIKEKNEINEYQEDYSNLVGALILEPIFQREYVWGKTKQRQLIDSIILGIPLPTFYFSTDKNGNFLVVDGKQRLKAILDFLNGKLSLPKEFSFLSKNKENKEVYFNDLETIIKTKIEDFSLSCYVVNSTLIPRLQNLIFMRVNRGGMSLNQQEIRNASNVGKSTFLLNKISDTKKLEIVPLKRKKDQYLAIRFFAFYLVQNNLEFNYIYSFETQYDGMDNFLDLVMKFLNIQTNQKIEEYFDLYQTRLLSALKLFNISSTRPFSRTGSSSVNMNIFETWMLILSQFDISIIENNADLFVEAYASILGNSDFIDNILYLRDQKDRIIWRLNFISSKIKEINIKIGE
ncbi:DUF262 domain-containing protein [Streptococcus sp.]|uniref:DUF262 domain-containing protein n=1 Tax=Streptococcus sp. TaxID=1306 RepID=UPI00291057FC|nr:DUF262 domain-containing protein [Streptococcus sp.]MDU5555810.1 DUF262 domain-containing protein [Streptococcus sp.]